MEASSSWAGVFKVWVGLSRRPLLVRTPGRTLQWGRERCIFLGGQPEEVHAKWLGETEDGDLKPLLKPFPGDQMRIWPISPRVNSPENNDPGIIDPIPGNMKHILTGLKIIGPSLFSWQPSAAAQAPKCKKSSAEKEREAWYSNYVDNTDRNWSEHL
jgi:hypothetical protein